MFKKIAILLSLFFLISSPTLAIETTGTFRIMNENNETIENKTIPGKILLNAAYLVDGEKEEAFDGMVNDLFEVWKDKVEFKYTGPWPAYNFVNIILRIEGK